jgi:hypothetical protein
MPHQISASDITEAVLKHQHQLLKLLAYEEAGHVACMGEGRGAYRILVGRPEKRRPLGKPRRRWEDNIKIDLQEVGWGTWTGLSWFRIRTAGGHL